MLRSACIRLGCHKPYQLLSHARAGSARRSSCVAAAKGGRRPRSRQEQEDYERDVDSTNELMQQLDIDSLLNDEQAMASLRARLLTQMATAHGEAAAKPPPPRSRVFDSDDYDMSALETGEVNGTASVDELAQEAAHKLAVDSSDIAEHIRAEHLHDSLIEERPTERSSERSSSGRASPDRDVSQASRRGRSDTQQKGQPGKLGVQQQQQAGGAGKRSSGSSQPDGRQRSSGGGGSSSAAGSSSDGRGGSGGSSSSRRGAGGSRELAGDTAIGRLAQGRPGIPLAVLVKGKARLFQAGSPMVYEGAVDCVIGRPPPAAGDTVVVTDHNLVPIAWGVYNSASMFRVRLLQVEAEALSGEAGVLDVPALVDLRVQQAVGLRAALGLPSQGTTDVFRLINSEGDRLSGVVADSLGDTVVVQSCAAWSERYRDVISEAIQRHTGCSRVVWRQAASILKEEGIDVDQQQQLDTADASSTPDTLSPLSSQSAASTRDDEDSEGSSDGTGSIDNSSSSSRHEQRLQQLLASAVCVREAGLQLLATPESGQKTGFYADQRHNRAFIASMSAGKTVLDLCCYTGGFGLMAAAAGAAAVTGVDTSATALALAQANAELNDLQDRCAFVRDDISTFLRAAIEAGEEFDIVVLDPPKLAPNRRSLPRATAKYRRLNALALAVVRSGGILMTCSCSGAMTQSGGLPRVVQEAAVEAGRQVTLLAKAGAAPDHPLHPAYPEGEYLSALTYRVL